MSAMHGVGQPLYERSGEELVVNLGTAGNQSRPRLVKGRVINADVDGDGTFDMAIEVPPADGDPITFADFVF